MFLWFFGLFLSIFVARISPLGVPRQCLSPGGRCHPIRGLCGGARGGDATDLRAADLRVEVDPDVQRGGPGPDSWDPWDPWDPWVAMGHGEKGWWLEPEEGPEEVMAGFLYSDLSHGGFS